MNDEKRLEIIRYIQSHYKDISIKTRRDGLKIVKLCDFEGKYDVLTFSNI